MHKTHVYAEFLAARIDPLPRWFSIRLSHQLCKNVATFFNPNFSYTFLSFLRTPYSLTSFLTLIAQEAGLNDTRFLSLLYGNDVTSQ